MFFGASDDLSHVLYTDIGCCQTSWGPGVYEFVGTGNDQPRRVDLDNTGGPVSKCPDADGASLPPATSSPQTAG